MSEEIIQYNTLENYIAIGEFRYIDLGKTTFNQLRKSNVISNSISNTINLKQPDALILDGGSYPAKIIAIVEYKKPSEWNTNKKKEASIQQVSEYCHFSGVNYGIVTNGTDYELLFVDSEQVEHDYSFSGIYGKYYADYILINNQKTILKNIKTNKKSQEVLIKAFLTTDSKNLSISDELDLVDPKSLAKSIWQSIWLATGDDPKKCLMTFTELFMYKYLSDLGILNEKEDGTSISFEETFSKGKDRCLQYYMNNVRDYIKEIFPKGADDTTIINGLSVKKDSNQDELFYSILEDFRNFGNLKNVSVEFKSNLFEEFLKGSNGIKLMAQFFTPRNIIRAIVNMANVSQLQDGQAICDPACGVGGFIIESMVARNIAKDFQKDKTSLSSKIVYSGYDLDKQTIILAKASLTMLLSSKINEYRNNLGGYAKFVNSVFESFHKSTIGSLRKTDGQYDLVLSNPPYVRKGMSLYRDFINNNIELSKFYDKEFDSKEGLFVINIVKSLKAKGRAFVVLPDGFFHTKSDRGLRNFLLEETIIDAIISLPSRTFYTTAKKTYILCLTKKTDNTILQTSPVFNYIVTDVGESLDIARVNTNLEDLNCLTREYKYFMADKEQYSSTFAQVFTKEIDYYRNEDMWLSERLLSDERLKELNIKEDEDFNSLIDVSQSLSEAVNELEKLNVELMKIDSSKESYSYRTITLNELDKEGRPFFEIGSSLIGYKQREYREKQVEPQLGYPLYTAAKNCVAYLPKNHAKLVTIENNRPHISIATDGDGTAGTNIILHREPYFLNTSRLSIKINKEEILPEYIYYSLKNIKKKYGFGYTIKCNKDNLEKYITLEIPVDEDGNISIEYQREVIAKMEQRESILSQLSDYEEVFKSIRKFSQFVAISEE
ncbi:N-6 DNA methylase [Enterococcus casseliflavus]|uniref:N-6 DNA methylase n=1 Tax=Enterococcus casseliflavus TaxID=37734 RepID=UPI0039A4508E